MSGISFFHDNFYAFKLETLCVTKICAMLQSVLLNLVKADVISVGIKFNG